MIHTRAYNLYDGESNEKNKYMAGKLGFYTRKAFMDGDRLLRGSFVLLFGTLALNP